MMGMGYSDPGSGCGMPTEDFLKIFRLQPAWWRTTDHPFDLPDRAKMMSKVRILVIEVSRHAIHLVDVTGFRKTVWAYLHMENYSVPN